MLPPSARTYARVSSRRIEYLLDCRFADWKRRPPIRNPRTHIADAQSSVLPVPAIRISKSRSEPGPRRSLPDVESRCLQSVANSLLPTGFHNVTMPEDHPVEVPAED